MFSSARQISRGFMISFSREECQKVVARRWSPLSIAFSKKQKYCLTKIQSVQSVAEEQTLLK